jgi:hypothetical protein
MPKPISPATAQSLGALLKSARDIMRKDKGLNGDLDRLPMLTWIMFLKFLDDLELQREEEVKLAGKSFKPAIEAPYRWRDWAANPQCVTGAMNSSLLSTTRKPPGPQELERHMVLPTPFADGPSQAQESVLSQIVSHSIRGVCTSVEMVVCT